MNPLPCWHTTRCDRVVERASERYVLSCSRDESKEGGTRGEWYWFVYQYGKARMQWETLKKSARGYAELAEAQDDADDFLRWFLTSAQGEWIAPSEARRATTGDKSDK